MNLSVLRLGLAALLALPVVASADPLLSFSPDVPLFITATASVRRDDNVFLTPTDQQADTIYILVPGLDFHWTGGKASLGITASEQFSRYSTNRQLNDHLATLGGNFGYKGTNSSLSLLGSYQQEDQTSLTAENSDQTVKHAYTTASANGEWQVGAKTSLGLGASFVRTVYPEAGFQDNDVWSFPVDLYYAVTPKTDVSLGYRADRTREDLGTLGNSEDNFYNVGARGQFTPRLSGQVRVGVTEYKPQVGARTSDLGLSANLDYAASPKTVFDLSAGSGFNTSPLGTGEKVVSVGLTGHTQFSQAWSGSLGTSYNSTDYLSTTDRIDKFWVGDVGLTYIWTKAVNFDLDYLYRRNNSTEDLAAFADNVWTFTVASRF